MADKVTIQISGDSSELTKALAEAVKAMGKVGEAAEGAAGRGTSAFDVFKGSLAADVFQKAIGAIVDGFGKIVDLSKEFISQASEQEQAVNALNLSLANSGKFSQEASQGIQDFAAELQDSSTVTDDAILKNAALIESLGRLDEEGLKRATKAALDFSVAFSVDFDTASRLVGKASEGNVEAFRKFGIQVEDTGDKTKDFNKLLQVLETRSSEAAKSVTNTFAGSFAQAGNAFEDIEKTVGGFITQSPGLIGAFKGITQVFKIFGDTLAENEDAVKGFVESGVDLFIKGIGVAGLAMNGFLDVQEGFQTFFTFLQDSFLSIVQGFNKFGIGIAEADRSIREFFGLSVDESEATQAGFQKNIDLLQKMRDDADAAAVESVRQNEARKASIIDYTEVLKTTVQEAVDAQRAAGEQEQADFLAKQNEKGIAAQAASAEELAFKQQFNAQLIADSIDTLGKIETAEFESKAKKLANDGKYTEALRLLAKQRELVDKNSVFAVKSYEESTQKERFENLKASLGSIATLQSSSSQELFAIGKAAAVATATIDGISAVQKALASAPPPFNFVIAALVGVATAVNVAKIASASPPKGAADGAFVTGGTAGQDDQPFMLSKGELVAPARSFDEVVEGTARARGFTKGDENSEVIALLQQLVAKASGTVIVNGDVMADELFINRLVDKIRDAVQFRGAQLA